MTEREKILLVESLHKKESLKLFYVAKKMLNDEDEAKDVVQECFSKLWVAKNYDNPRHYLYNCVYTICFNELKMRHRHEKVNRIVAEETETIQEAFDGLMIKKEIVSVMVMAIKKFSSEKRKIMELLWTDGLEYEEIAARLKIKIDTVRVQVSRGMKTLKKIAAKQYPEMVRNVTRTDTQKRNMAMNRKRKAVAMDKFCT